MIGQRLLHYEVLDKLGEGGMGVVYKARDTHLDRFVAIKVLPPKKLADPSRRARFVLEAKSASALNHPNIVTIYDISCDNGVDFIAMEYVQGKTLDQLIPRKGMRLNETLKIAVQVADALARAHEAGIIHRDLKPANIMVDARGRTKVLDFGLAKLAEVVPISEDESTRTLKPTTEEGTIVGTAAYMSPEQAEGRPVDARSDIFSFGAVLYEMITGRRAFQGDSRMSTLFAVLQHEPKPMNDAPHDLEKVVTRCLKKDPERRFFHMIDLEVALKELCEESESRPGAAAVSSLKRVRHRLVDWLFAPLVLALVGLLAFSFLGRKAPTPRLVQLTSYPGSEMYPCFSPDGNQVAFSWSEGNAYNADIYVKLVGESDALRLTTDPASDQWPAWSPDGKRIAFQRNRRGTAGIWSVSPLGGAEQKLADLQVMGQMSWSPDGQWLAVARGSFTGTEAQDVGPVRGIFLVRVKGDEPRRLSDPKPPAYDICPSFSPDGRQLAYASCSSAWSCDIFLQQLDAGYVPRGEARRITREGRYIHGLAWSRDRTSLIYGGYLSWGMGMRLRRVGISGKQPSEPLDLAGSSAYAPAVAMLGDRLAFSRSYLNHDIWRYQIGGVPAAFIASSLHDVVPQFSPDGNRIAFASNRSGEMVEIWATDAEGLHPVQLAKGLGRGQGTPRWSPDGLLVTFDSLEEHGKSQIYVVDAKGGRPWRASPEASNGATPSFSRDGKWIYFFSNQTGRNEVWRVPFRGGAAQQITEQGGDTAFESTDGKTLFYTKSENSPLYAKPLDGGAERKVLDYVFRRSFVPFENGIYYIGRRDADNLNPIQFYEFSTGASRVIVKIEGPLHIGLSVSPDGKTFLFSKSVTSGADLMMIENFR